MKFKIDKSYKIRIEISPGTVLTYKCVVTDDDENSVSFCDDRGKISFFNKKLILTAVELDYEIKKPQESSQ